MPAYQRIASFLRAQIASGELAPDARLPTEQELAMRYGVARQTARSGIEVLIREGLVVARRPLGHFVRRRDAELSYFPQQESSRGARQDGETFVQRTVDGRIRTTRIDIELVQARHDVASRLQVDAETVIVARRRVRLIDGRPVNTSDTYYPLELTEGSPIMSTDDIEADTDQILADLGYPQTRAVDEIFVRMPTPDETDRLDLGPGTPVAVHYATGYTADDRPVRCTISVLPGDLHRIVFDRDFE